VNQRNWCNRRFAISVLIAVLASGFASAGFCQNPMPPLGDKHFCEWWQAKIGPASDPKPAQPQPSKKPAGTATSGNSGADQDLDAFDSAAPSDPDHVTALDDATVLAAMACLLQMEGETGPANFMGVTWVGVSQIFDSAPMNLASLYYVSYLFTCNWRHGSAIALRGPGAQVRESKIYRTTPWATHKAYPSYRHWYEQVKAMGLANAREEKLDPLAGTGLYWY
jgi:hypothetical protein